MLMLKVTQTLLPGYFNPFRTRCNFLTLSSVSYQWILFLVLTLFQIFLYIFHISEFSHLWDSFSFETDSLLINQHKCQGVFCSDYLLFLSCIQEISYRSDSKWIPSFSVLRLSFSQGKETRHVVLFIKWFFPPLIGTLSLSLSPHTQTRTHARAKSIHVLLKY